MRRPVRLKHLGIYLPVAARHIRGERVSGASKQLFLLIYFLMIKNWLGISFRIYSARPFKCEWFFIMKDLSWIDLVASTAPYKNQAESRKPRKPRKPRNNLYDIKKHSVRNFVQSGKYCSIRKFAQEKYK
jgi:hypothetical protein